MERRRRGIATDPRVSIRFDPVETGELPSTEPHLLQILGVRPKLKPSDFGRTKSDVKVRHVFLYETTTQITSCLKSEPHLIQKLCLGQQKLRLDVQKLAHSIHKLIQR